MLFRKKQEIIEPPKDISDLFEETKNEIGKRIGLNLDDLTLKVKTNSSGGWYNPRQIEVILGDKILDEPKKTMVHEIGHHVGRLLSPYLHWVYSRRFLASGYIRGHTISEGFAQWFAYDMFSDLHKEKIDLKKNLKKLSILERFILKDSYHFGYKFFREIKEEFGDKYIFDLMEKMPIPLTELYNPSLHIQRVKNSSEAPKLSRKNICLYSKQLLRSAFSTGAASICGYFGYMLSSRSIKGYYDFISNSNNELNGQGLFAHLSELKDPTLLMFASICFFIVALGYTGITLSNIGSLNIKNYTRNY